MLKELTAVGLLIMGVIMAFIALFMPPPGEIHDSVLYIFAQILIYAGTVFGFGAYVDQLKDKPTSRDPTASPPAPPLEREGRFKPNNETTKQPASPPTPSIVFTHPSGSPGIGESNLRREGSEKGHE